MELNSMKEELRQREKNSAVRVFSNLVYEGSNNRESTFDLFMPEEVKHQGIVVFAHGYKGFKDWGPWHLVANYFAQRGFVFSRFNFSHNGGTVKDPIDFPDEHAFAENTYSAELEDLDHFFNALYGFSHVNAARLPHGNIYLIGHSRGGAMSILKTACDARIKKLATWAAVADLGERFNFDLEKWKEEGVVYIKNSRTGQLLPHYYSFYTDYLQNKNKLEVGKAAAAISVPWLIVHGKDDETVPFSDAEKLFEKSKHAILTAIPNTGHTFGGAHPWNQPKLPQGLEEVVKTTAEFFAD